jgi:protein JSN1
MVSPTKPLTHSSRSSLSPDKAGSRPDGRTPPPAPSSGYARRAREIIENEGAGPIARQDILDDDQVIGSGYRRARAGYVLPHKSHLANLGKNADTARSTLPSSFVDRPAERDLDVAMVPSAQHVRTSALSPAFPAPTAVRPGLRHTNSSTGNLDNPASNRHRAGSLTMPEGGLGNGSSFGNGWLATPGVASGPSRSPLGQLVSPGDESLPNEDFNSTLDYLGLADGSGGHQPASMSEARHQAQRAIAQSGPASRHRASTVSNFARPYRQPLTNQPGYSNGYDYEPPAADEELCRAIDSLGMYDNDYGGNGHFYATAGIFNRDPNRPRSTTLGTVNDNPMKRSQSVRKVGYLASIPQSPVGAHMDQPGVFGYNPRSYSERDLTRSRDSSSSRGPRLSISSHTSRTGTPDFEKGSSTPQMPTRSLWIGNLDVNATSDALFHVFNPYGPIESVRLLPEKVRG